MSGAVPQCAIDLIKQFEGYEKKLPDGRVAAYPDPITGWDLPTIGYGSTKYPDGSAVKRDDVIDRPRAEECLIHEVEEKCRPALEAIPSWGQMNDNQRGALYCFAYNLGARFYRGGNFQSITRVCDTPQRWGDDTWIEEQFVKYRNPGSAAEAGLRRRREAEAKLFCTQS
jgi:GH24 family phage-related lysozyme (muramidase)